jgi:hypothetical protein
MYCHLSPIFEDYSNFVTAFVSFHPSEIINILDRAAIGIMSIGTALAIFEI